MKTNKLPTALTDEELLEGLNSNEEVQKPLPNTVVAFLVFYNITPGLNTVKTTLLFDLYTRWSRNPVRAHQFYQEAAKYLPTSHFIKTQQYHINFNAFQLGEKTFELLKKTKHISKSPTFNKHFQNFIKNHDIQDGAHWTTYPSLYEEYLSWRIGKTKVTKLSKSTFYKFIKLYFKKHKQDGHIKYVAINRKLSEKDKKENKLKISD